VTHDATFSPQPTDRKQRRVYSPYLIADFLEVSRHEALSPDIFLELTNSFKRIM
jgi:hypothetical protein